MSDAVIIAKFADTKTDHEITIVDAGNEIRVKVNILPPARLYWSEPSTEQMRKWVDDAIKASGRKRNGARKNGSSDVVRSWYVYPVSH